MKKYLITLGAVCCMFCGTAFAQSNPKLVGDVIKATGGDNKPAELGVITDEDSDMAIMGVSAGFANIRAKSWIRKDSYKDFLASLVKAKEWARKAHENSLNTRKLVKSYKCRVNQFITSHIDLTFVSKGDGKDVQIVIEILDTNGIAEVTIHLNEDQLDQLIKNVQLVPDTIKKIKEEQKRANDILN